MIIILLFFIHESVNGEQKERGFGMGELGKGHWKWEMEERVSLKKEILVTSSSTLF